MIGKETAGTKNGSKRVRVSIRCSVNAKQKQYGYGGMQCRNSLMD
jgi:hypothetical protein